MLLIALAINGSGPLVDGVNVNSCRGSGADSSPARPAVPTLVGMRVSESDAVGLAALLSPLLPFAIQCQYALAGWLPIAGGGREWPHLVWAGYCSSATCTYMCAPSAVWASCLLLLMQCMVYACGAHRSV